MIHPLSALSPELRSFQRDVDALLDAAFGPGVSGRHGLVADPAWERPHVHLYDAGDALVLTAEVPGMGPEQVEVQVTRDEIALRGERRVEAPEGYRPLRSERASWRFDRRYRLPREVDPDRVEATVADGLLTVRLPHSAELAPRRIAVKTA